MRQSPPRSIAEVLGPVLARLSTERRAAFPLQPAWARVLGVALAAHTRVASFENARLFVVCDSEALAQTLTARREELRARLNAELGGESVHSLEVRGP